MGSIVKYTQIRMNLDKEINALDGMKPARVRIIKIRRY